MSQGDNDPTPDRSPLSPRPRARTALHTASVGDRFVILDVQQRRLIELRPDLKGLWPLLDGRLDVTALAELWSGPSRATDTDPVVAVIAALDELASAGMLAQPDD